MVRFYECGICDHVHPWDWNGDCRDDANRFTNAEVEALVGAEIRTWQERLRADDYGDHVVFEDDE